MTTQPETIIVTDDSNRLDPEILLVPINKARMMLGGIARSTVYELLKSGDLKSAAIRKRRFIIRQSMDELIQRGST